MSVKILKDYGYHCLHPDTCNPDKGEDGCICECHGCKCMRAVAHANKKAAELKHADFRKSYATQLENRNKAIGKILYGLRHPLMMMSKPDREELTKLAIDHDISAADLLHYAANQARNA